jgi:hypothetical protein
MLDANESSFLASGTPVEVWCRSYGTWASGFVVIDWDGNGVAVRRVADDAVLPARFSAEDIRRT